MNSLPLDLRSKMFEWKEEYSVGISIIDEEHKKIVNIINKAIAAKQYDDNSKKIEEVLNEMIDYAWNHFLTEECYMFQFKYPEYRHHKEEHDDFVHRTISYLQRIAYGENQIADKTFEFLKQWLVNHIQLTDKKFRDCFIKNGLK